MVLTPKQDKEYNEFLWKYINETPFPDGWTFVDFKAWTLKSKADRIADFKAWAGPKVQAEKDARQAKADKASSDLTDFDDTINEINNL